MNRKPAVAGTFYPSDSNELYNFIKNTAEHPEKKENAYGVIVPHAGYIYSGKVASKVFSQISIPDSVIVLAPNHTGLGRPVSLWDKGRWFLPESEIQVDESLSEKLLSKSDYIEVDYDAHRYEHSIEVQLPFLYFYNKNVKIVPLVLFPFDYKYCVNIGESIAEAVIESGKDVLIVASSDMSHYIDVESAKKLDNMAFKSIEMMDPEDLYYTVRRNNITMCGYIPATIMLIAAKKLGAVKTKLVAYTNSGEVSGDYSSVVSYAGFIVK